MQTLTALLLVLAAAASSPARAASIDPAPLPADSSAIPGLDRNPAGGALLEIPATTFT